MHTLVFNILAALSCGYALLRGGAPERAAVLVFVLGIIATIATIPAGGHHFRRLELDVFLVDLATYCALQAIALVADRFWTIWVAALQLATVLVHVAIAVIPDFVPFAYSAGTRVWAYLILGLFVAGTWRHRERLRAFGVDPGWRVERRAFDV